MRGAEPGAADEASLAAAIREPVRLVPYDPAWPAAFERERARLDAALPGVFLELQHVGSTAVPGMPAKPVIDIVAGAATMERVAALVATVCGAGYTTSAAFNATLHDRRWFMRWADGRRTHHLHLTVRGGDFWRAQLGFRDALRASPALAARYAALKARLALEHAHDREAYTDAKAAFVRAVLARA